MQSTWSFFRATEICSHGDEGPGRDVSLREEYGGVRSRQPSLQGVLLNKPACQVRISRRLTYNCIEQSTFMWKVNDVDPIALLT